MALRPPVSAMNGMMAPSRFAIEALMARAVSVPPVKATPSIPGWETRAAPTVSPRPGTRASRSGLSPALWNRRTASAAISGVCSAGLASTALPAASAAAIWPVKMARGKFHGLMQAKTPRPCRARELVSPTGPVRGSAPPNCCSASMA